MDGLAHGCWLSVVIEEGEFTEMLTVVLRVGRGAEGSSEACVVCRFREGAIIAKGFWCSRGGSAEL